MGKIQTCILIDENKKRIAKKMGIIFSNLFENALNAAINFNEAEGEKLVEMSDLVEKKEKLVNKNIEIIGQLNEINTKISTLELILQKKQEKESKENERMAESLIQQGFLHEAGGQ